MYVCLYVNIQCFIQIHSPDIYIKIRTKDILTWMKISFVEMNMVT